MFFNLTLNCLKGVRRALSTIKETCSRKEVMNLNENEGNIMIFFVNKKKCLLLPCIVSVTLILTTYIGKNLAKTLLLINLAFLLYVIIIFSAHEIHIVMQNSRSINHSASPYGFSDFQVMS